MYSCRNSGLPPMGASEATTAITENILPTWGQFHQHSTSSFYARRSRKCKKLLDLTVFFALLGSSSVKAACRMLMKLTPGFYLTNILLAAFALADPASAKKTVKSSSCFVLLGSVSVKAAHRTLVKLTPDSGFHTTKKC